MNSLVIGMGSMAFGKERRAVRMFTRMRGVRPYFLTSKWEDGSVSSLLERNGLAFSPATFGYLGRAKPAWTLVNLINMPLLFGKVVGTCLRERCDVIVVLSLAAFVNALPSILLLKYLAGRRVVFYLGDTPKNYTVNRVIARLVNKSAAHVIANSEAVRRGLAAVGVDEGRLRVIYNGVDTDRFEGARPKDFRGRFGWPADAILVGFAGQLRPNKGARDLAEAAELTLKSDARCRFVMVGRLDEGDAFQQELAEYVETRGLSPYVAFAGWVDEIEGVLAGLDIVVVPSRHEDPAPNVNIEAMASGLPVVATRVGGTPELILDGETGFLVDKGRPDQIAERVVRLAADAGLRKRMGSAGVERARSMFDVEKNARLVEEVLLNG